MACRGVRRTKGVRTTIPSKDGKRAGDLLDRDFTALAPNRTWVTDFTYVRAWAGFVYVAFILDVFAQKIVAWHAATSKDTDLVMPTEVTSYGGKLAYPDDDRTAPDTVQTIMRFKNPDFVFH